MKDEHVEAAMSILSDEVERVLIETNDKAKKCIEERKYDEVPQYTDRAKLLVLFQDKIDVLVAEWDVLDEDRKEKTMRKKQNHVSPAFFHHDCIKRIETYLKTKFNKRSRSTFISDDDQIALVCAISKRYDGASHNYWFSYHPHQGNFLSSSKKGYFLFGCGEANRILLFPFNDLKQWIERVNKTTREDGTYYFHVKFAEEGKRMFSILEGRNQRIDVTNYLVALPTKTV